MKKQYSMAVQDVSLEFARQMKTEHLTDLDADKLIAFRIFSVDSSFIEDLRATGLKISDSDKLVAFRIHGVTPQMIRSLHQAGYSPDEDTLIAMRIHGATPEWMDGTQEARLRSHGPRTADRIQHPRRFARNSSRSCKAWAIPILSRTSWLRCAFTTYSGIHQPICASRGMQNLSIDQLVSMRIHGID